jgi:hypothetical protein
VSGPAKSAAWRAIGLFFAGWNLVSLEGGMFGLAVVLAVLFAACDVGILYFHERTIESHREAYRAHRSHWDPWRA